MRRYSVTAMVLCVLMAPFASALAQGRLLVEQGWIPPAPPGAAMFAGYATLRNAGDAPLHVVAARSPLFADVSLHETRVENDVARMRPLGKLSVAPGEAVQLAPGGRHLMLMRPSTSLTSGAAVPLSFVLEDGSEVSASFVVRDASTVADH